MKQLVVFCLWARAALIAVSGNCTHMFNKNLCDLKKKSYLLIETMTQIGLIPVLNHYVSTILTFVR